jgi:hypothetical protein
MPPKSNPDDDELKRKFVEGQEREQRQREERRQREEERERRRLKDEQRLQDAGAGAGAAIVDDALMSRLETIFMQLDARNAKRQADQERMFAEWLLAMESRIRSEVGNAKREANESSKDRANVFEARVPATTVPPPKLAFVGLDAVDFESWRDCWNAYLENAGVEGIRDPMARARRKKGLLTQALDDAGQAWVREQGWGDRNADDIVKAVEEKIANEADPRTQLVGLMGRTWIKGEQVDAFWLDVQRRARYCGFCGDCGDKVLRAIWAKNFVDPATQADINKDPKLRAAECYRIAKGFENARLNAEKWAREATSKPEVVELNRTQVSGYRRQQRGPTAARPSPSTPECARCGTSHPPRSCPAYGRKCKKCGKNGHFDKCCWATVNAVNAGVTINAMGYEPEVDNARGAAAATWSPEDRLRDEMAFRGMSR